MKKTYNTSLLLIIFTCALYNHHAMQASTTLSNVHFNETDNRDLHTPQDLIIRADNNSAAQIISNSMKRSFSEISDTPTEIYTIPVAIKVQRLLDQIEQNENDSFEEFEYKTDKRKKIINANQEALKTEACRNNSSLNKFNSKFIPKNTLLHMR